MLYETLADLVVIVHGLFVLFVVFGGLAALRWQRLAWLHVPAAVWGTAIELEGWVCPLTYVENYLRHLAGESGYATSFIEQYLEPLLYPLGLTPRSQVFLGLGALLINMTIYAVYWRRRRG